jgi:hypothetical protein
MAADASVRDRDRGSGDNTDRSDADRGGRPMVSDGDDRGVFEALLHRDRIDALDDARQLADAAHPVLMLMRWR